MTLKEPGRTRRQMSLLAHDPLFSVRSCLQAWCTRRCAEALGPARGAKEVSVGHHSGDLWVGGG